MIDRLRHHYYRITLLSLGRIALLLLLPAVTAGAQEFRGSLTGKITDSAGAALVGASVSVKNVETNIVNSTTTNEDGVYNFPLLQPGKYQLSVTQQGFKAAQRGNIELRVADRLTLDVKLDVGAATESVQIIGSSPALETGSVSTGTVISSQQISELPLTEGTAYQLATLAPGIFYTGNPLFNGPTSNGNLSAFRSNGATGRNQITLDGTPNFAFDGGVGFSPPSDAVQEFKVQTNVFDAQQGYSAGGTVNVAVKSGTNGLHGSLWYFNRDRSRTANNFFSNSLGQERPERTYHRYGGVVSGPVRIPKLYNGRDRTFFLFSYERLKDNVAEPQLFTVPTVKMRQGDFSDLLTLGTPTQLFNPFSGRAVGANVQRDPFRCDSAGNPLTPLANKTQPAGTACNKIPATLINPIALEYMKYFPMPNAPGNADGTNNYFSNMIRHQNYRAYLTRIDHKISEKQSIFGKYFRSFNPEDRYDWAGVVNGFPVTKGFEFRTNDGGNIDYTATLSPRLVLDLRTGVNRFAQERRPGAEFDPALLGFTGPAMAAMRGYQYLPRFDIRTYDAGRPIRSVLGSNRADYNEGLLRPFQMASFQPTVTQIFGNHSTKYGYDFRVIRENFTSDGYQGGRFFFDGTYTSPASNSSTTIRNAYGRDVAAFLLGIPSVQSTQSRIENPVNYSVQSLFHGFFYHDDWRVTSKLTLNLGLRYEVEKGLTERFNRIVRGIDLTTPSPVEAAAKAAYTAAYNANPSAFPLPPDQFHVVGGLNFSGDDNRNIWDADKSNWQPRVGLAYKLTEKTVLRGGFGIFMAPFQVETPFQPGFSGSTPFVPTNDNGRTFIATLSDPFPGGLTASPGASMGLLTNVGGDLGASDAPVIPINRRNAKFARLIFGVQQELPGQFVVEANFVTARGYDLAVARNLNFVPRQFLGDTPATDTAANTFLGANNIIPNPFRNLLPNTGSPFNTATNITRAQSLMAFPQFTNVWVQQYNGTNRYNSLQLQAQKRFSTSLSFTGTYTFTRLRERVNYLNPSDTVLENRVSPDERPHRVTLAGIYQLPIGRGRKFGGDLNRALDAFVGGWQLNGTYEWQKGEPFLFTNPLYFAGDVTQLKSRIGQKDGQGRTYGIDISAFDPGLVRLSAFGFRNVPTTLDNLRNQSFLNVNLSVSKDFNVSEGKRLQFRAEWLNAFNSPYFGNGIQLDPNNQAFGFVTTQRNNPRDVQLGLKFTY
jgi:carboxypeptidase family protein